MAEIDLPLPFQEGPADPRVSPGGPACRRALERSASDGMGYLEIPCTCGTCPSTPAPARTSEERVHLPARSDEWETPSLLFDLLDQEFGFEIDAAASEDNHLCETYFTREDSGLDQPWRGPVWCNPPYSDLPRWIRKAWEECRVREATVVLLIPAYTDTAVWHEVIFPHASEVRLLKGRLRFCEGGVPRSTARFPSAVVVFRPGPAGRPCQLWGWDWRV